MANPEQNELSERELEILRLVATGASNKEIAAKLFISSNTVKVHLRNIFSKIGVVSRTEAAMHAVRMGLVEAVTGQIPVEGSASPRETITAEAQPPAALGPVIERKAWPRWATALLALVVISLAGIAFVLGRGSISEATLNTVTMLPATPTSYPRWQSLAALPAPRGGLALAALESKLYAIGGESSEGISAALEVYNLDDNRWSALADKPTPVTEARAVVINGLIYVPGGRSGANAEEISRVLEIYDPRQDAWSTGAQLPTPISAYALVAFEGRMYLFGGWDGTQILSSVYMYEPGLDSWQERSPMPTNRAFSGAAVASGKIYVLGGMNGEGTLDAASAGNWNEIYSPARDSVPSETDGDSPWETGFPIPDTRVGFQVTTIADTIYVLGGTDQTGSRFGLIYFPPTNTWQSLEASPQPLGGSFGLTSIGPNLYIVGGETEGRLSDQNLAYQALITLSIPIIIK